MAVGARGRELRLRSGGRRRGQQDSRGVVEWDERACSCNVLLQPAAPLSWRLCRYGMRPNVNAAVRAYSALAREFGMTPTELAIRYSRWHDALACWSTALSLERGLSRCCPHASTAWTAWRS